MRAPKRRRQQLRQIAVPDGADLGTAAKHAVYVGSPEHKATPSFAGMSRPRADASLCDSALNSDEGLRKIVRWLRTGIRRGVVSGLWEGQFPRYVWYKDGNIVYEARLVNKGNGTYKGYPLESSEWPLGIEAFYGG